MEKGSRVVVLTGWFAGQYGTVEDIAPDGFLCVKLDDSEVWSDGWIVELAPHDVELEEREDLWTTYLT